MCQWWWGGRCTVVQERGRDEGRGEGGGSEGEGEG